MWKVTTFKLKSETLTFQLLEVPTNYVKSPDLRSVGNINTPEQCGNHPERIRNCGRKMKQ